MSEDKIPLIQSLIESIRQYGRDARYAIPKPMPYYYDIPSMYDTMDIDFAVTMLLRELGPILAEVGELRVRTLRAEEALVYAKHVVKAWDDPLNIDPDEAVEFMRIALKKVN